MYLSLDKDAPEPRPVHAVETGIVIELQKSAAFTIDTKRMAA
jgi:hypothetical protein